MVLAIIHSDIKNMGNELTPEQNEQLKTWAGQRDALLLGISQLRTQYEKDSATNKILAESNTEIQNSINESKGRLKELLATEQEFSILTLKENVLLQAEKSTLEATITGLKNEVSLLEKNKVLLSQGNTELKDAHDRAFNRINSIDKIVEHVTRVSSANISDIEKLLVVLTDSVKSIVAINEMNVAATNVVIDKLPKVFFDVQRQSLKKIQI